MQHRTEDEERQKVITYLEMNLEATFLEHLELNIGGNFFNYSNK